MSSSTGANSNATSVAFSQTYEDMRDQLKLEAADAEVLSLLDLLEEVFAAAFGGEDTALEMYCHIAVFAYVLLSQLPHVLRQLVRI